MTRQPRSDADINVWQVMQNNFMNYLNGDHEYFSIITNGNNPPTVKANTRFMVYKTDTSYTISNDDDTGNNEYVQGDTPTVLLNQTIYELADRTSTYAGTTDFPTISDGTWYMYCRGCLDTDATTIGKGSYWISKTDAPAINYLKGGYYNTSDGLSRCICQWTVASSTVSALIIYKVILPYTMGTAGQRATSNGDGTMSWQTPTMTRSTASKGVSYVILDNDGYDRIEVDTTSGDITITLPTRSDNLGRRIEIANVKGGTNKVIIAADAGESKITADGLAALWLPKIGDYIVLQECATSGFWEVVDEKITAQLRLNTYAGYGDGSHNKIPYFTNVVENIGNCFTVVNNSTNGCEITINRSGFYEGNFTFGTATSGTTSAGTSLNSSQLTTDVASITITDVITRCTVANVSGGIDPAVSSFGLCFKKGDVIRPHTDGDASGASGTLTFFNFSKR